MRSTVPSFEIQRLPFQCNKGEKDYWTQTGIIISYCTYGYVLIEKKQNNKTTTL